MTYSIDHLSHSYDTRNRGGALPFFGGLIGVKYYLKYKNESLKSDTWYPLVGHAVIASGYRAGGPWFDTRCGQFLY